MIYSTFTYIGRYLANFISDLCMNDRISEILQSTALPRYILNLPFAFRFLELMKVSNFTNLPINHIYLYDTR